MKEFDRKNIGLEWVELSLEFPEIFLEPSPEVLQMFNEKHPLVPDKVEELCNLRYGFECGIGWEQIIREFCEDIRKLVQIAKDNGHEIHYKTFILKQKFGEIRDQGDFYGPDANMYYDDYRAISYELERKSSGICENCGEPASLLKNGWLVKTLCGEKCGMPES